MHERSFSLYVCLCNNKKKLFKKSEIRNTGDFVAIIIIAYYMTFEVLIFVLHRQSQNEAMHLKRSITKYK